MYCTKCGVQTGDADKYCRECGHETPLGREANQRETFGYEAPRRLYRATASKKIAGVCSGIAEYLAVDVTLVRLAVAAGTLFSGGLGLLAYIVAWIIMPRDQQMPPFRSPNSAPTRTTA